MRFVHLGAGLGVAWVIRAQGSNDSRVSKDSLRDDAVSLGKLEIRPGIESCQTEMDGGAELVCRFNLWGNAGYAGALRSQRPVQNH